ncbi:hypothetical protein EI005_25700, partial [Escherichia coli]|nr:hypothetical protein [Escherichia coli]
MRVHVAGECRAQTDSSGPAQPPTPSVLTIFSADIYNWKINHPLSQDPQRLTGLVESLMFSHQPTWDDCQQLLQMLFTTEEQERILLEARKIAWEPTGGLHSYKMRSIPFDNSNSQK